LLVEIQSEPGEHALCYLDLDNFKVINDSCGHLAGDELLRQLARKLRKQVRSADLLARLGGDEFGVLLRDCPTYQAQTIAETIRATVEVFRFTWSGRNFKVGASIGVVPLAAGEMSLEMALREADSACYAAKQAGRNRVCMFAGTDTATQSGDAETLQVGEVRQALEHDRFEIYWQAVQGLSEDPQGKCVEVLLRLTGDDGKCFLPSQFLPAAERYSMAADLDRWVVEHVLKWLGENRQIINSLDVCTINLSTQTIGDDAFVELLQKSLRERGVPAEKLGFELAETSALASFSATLRFTEALHALGCRLCLDDFGNGFSSFAYLKQLPVDCIKIDGSLIRSSSTDKADLAVVDAIVRIGGALGVRTVAKCIENATMLEQMRGVNVAYAQGFHLHQPQPLAALAEQA